MNKGPNIVANRWHEVASSLEKTGFFQEDQLNLEDVLRILTDLVRRYTAVLGYVAEGELTPIGSGTFLRRKDGQCGILTAGHVVGAIKNKESIRVLPTQDREEVDWIGIEGMGMHGWGETNTGLKGPDIGWMPLSAKEAASIESLGGVFHNRRRTMEDFSGEVCQISVAFGFVDAASSPSDKKIVAHPMFIGRRRRGRIPLYPGISRILFFVRGLSRAPRASRGVRIRRNESRVNPAFRALCAGIVSARHQAPDGRVGLGVSRIRPALSHLVSHPKTFGRAHGPAARRSCLPEPSRRVPPDLTGSTLREATIRSGVLATPACLSPSRLRKGPRGARDALSRAGGRHESAAHSLAEGLGETLTLHRLGRHGVLGRSLNTKNCLESISALVDEYRAKADHWQHSNHRYRWLAAALFRVRTALGTGGGSPLPAQAPHGAKARPHDPQGSVEEESWVDR